MAELTKNILWHKRAMTKALAPPPRIVKATDQPITNVETTQNFKYPLNRLFLRGTTHCALLTEPWKSKYRAQIQFRISEFILSISDG